MTRGNELNFQLRKARLEDTASISFVLYQSFVEYKPLYTDKGFAATTPTPEQIVSRLSEGPIWVATRQEMIIGTVSVIPRGDALYIRSMAVLPIARAQGIGRRLLDQAEEFAIASRFKRMFLCTTLFLLGAIRLYEQFGFRRSVDENQDLFGTPIFTMEKMVRAKTE